MSMRMRLCPILSNTEGRRRLSCGSVDWQTLQVQPIIGTPTLVPEPRTRMEAGSRSAGMLRGFGAFAAVGGDD